MSVSESDILKFYFDGYPVHRIAEMIENKLDNAFSKRQRATRAMAIVEQTIVDFYKKGVPHER